MTTTNPTTLADADQARPDWLPATRTRRASAWLITSTVNTTIGLAAVVGLTNTIDPASPPLAALGGVAVSATAATILVQFNVVAVARHGGRPGHRVCGLRVKDEQHRPISRQRAAARFALEFVIAMLAVGGLIVAAVDVWLVLFSPSRRRIVDRLVGTAVLQARSDDRNSRER